MKRFHAILFLLISFSFKTFDSTTHTLSSGSFTQDWTNVNLITANDNWSGVTSIQGFLGDYTPSSTTGVDPQTVLVAMTAIDVLAQITPTNTNGGVGEFDGLANPVIGLQGSGTADALNLVIYLNTVNRNNINVQYTIRDIDGTSDNAVQSVALQYRISNTGDFINIPAGFVADATTGPGIATLETNVNVTLPVECENKSHVELRIITTNAAGSDEWVGIDNINISSSSSAGPNVSITGSTSATEPSSNGSFTFSYSPASSGVTSIDYAFTGSATFETDYTVSFSTGTPTPNSASGTLTGIPDNTSIIIVTVIPVNDAATEITENITLTLSNPPAGYTAGPSSTIDLLDDDALPVISLSAVTSAAEPLTVGNFTINLSAPTTISTTIDFAFTGTATFTSDYTSAYSNGAIASGTLSSGTLTIPVGVSTVNVSVTPVNDSEVEPQETIILTLSNPSPNFTLGTSSASINISSDDVIPTVSVTAGTNAGEPGTNSIFTISVNSPAPPGGATVSYTLSGTASLNTDYSNPQGGSVTIPAEASTATVNISVINDLGVEQAETIILTITSVSAPYEISSNPSGTIYITEDDILPIPLVTSYSQDFNTLITTGTSQPFLLSGWGIQETGNGARFNQLYTADAGTGTSGDVISYGSVASNDRSLGSLASGSLTSSFGSYYINNSGAVINRVKINYTGEEWRLGNETRRDRLAFQYSLNATTITTGTWNNFGALDFFTPNIVGTGAKDGNAIGNRAEVSYTITGLNIPAGGTFFIRWKDTDTTNSDDGLSIDDLTIEINPSDFVAPLALSFSPVPASIDRPVYISATITFNEDVTKGTGNIHIKRMSDNSTLQIINVASSAVTVSGNAIFFVIEGLAYSTGYYIEIDNGAITDVLGNSYTGITGQSAWSFTTRTAPVSGIVGNNYDFNTCAGPVPDGFTEFSITGSSVWTCTNFGHNPNRPGVNNSDSIYGLQMNGFANNSNFTNEDWLISPSFDLTGTEYPLLSFYTRTAFNGSTLQLRVSTDYVSGNPASATWIDLNGKFPELATNIWMKSDNINLRAYRQANVHFAFVYTSSDQDGARWTLDEILLENSLVPPPPSLTVSTNDIQFGFAPSGGTVDKSFRVIGNDLTHDLKIQPVSGSPFSISLLPAGPFTDLITLDKATYNNVPTTIYVRFAPQSINQNFNKYLGIWSPGSSVYISDTVFLKGTSIDPVNTLEIVNWNLEWFGSTANGPTNKAQQEANVQTILQNIGADIYGLVEVVDEAALARVVGNMPGYSYIISDYGSHTNPYESNPGPLSAAQKEAFVYKTSMFSNITTAPLVTEGVNTPEDLNNPAFNWFASGRYPFMMKADVTLNGLPKTMRFVLLHGKADTDNGSYIRRKNGSDTLKFTLNNLYPNDNIIVFGDINDDLDSTISEQINPRITSYIAFRADTVTTFTAPTLALSIAGKKSTVGYNDMIDHVIVSNEVIPYYYE